jgi:3-hydroxyisobutyrate dehydrogenase-like beta-hydroxyacid dehydrogenase
MSDDKQGPRIGLVGLGNAGSAMLRALSAHFLVHVYDQDPDAMRQAVATCDKLPIVQCSAAQLAAAADLVILSLPTPAASLEVAKELVDHLHPGSLIVESSTVSPEDVEALQDLLSPAQARVVDAPLVGGVQRLAMGKAVFLVGGTEASAGAVGHVLAHIADEVFFLGRCGNGMRTKLIVNAIAHVVYVSLMEAGALAAAQGVPLAIFQTLLERDTGLMRPLTHRFSERLLNHDFSGGMSTANARKDSALFMDAARKLGVPLFATAAAHSVYELAVHEGLEKLDYASIGTLWEKWAGISFSQTDAIGSD